MSLTQRKFEGYVNILYILVVSPEEADNMHRGQTGSLPKKKSQIFEKLKGYCLPSGPRTPTHPSTPTMHQQRRLPTILAGEQVLRMNIEPYPSNETAGAARVLAQNINEAYLKFFHPARRGLSDIDPKSLAHSGQGVTGLELDHTDRINNILCDIEKLDIVDLPDQAKLKSFLVRPIAKKGRSASETHKARPKSERRMYLIFMTTVVSVLRKFYFTRDISTTILEETWEQRSTDGVASAFCFGQWVIFSRL